MLQYVLTVFSKSGKTLMDHPFYAQHDDEAKATGKMLLIDKGYEEKTHRCVSPNGSLLLFHR